MKWVGGKTQLLPVLLPLFPYRFGRYYEPFTGGGATFFSLASNEGFEFGHAVLNDWNAELINAYEVVRDHPDNLVATLLEWKSEYVKDPETVYYAMRARDPKEMTVIDRAARTLFLNKTCFNGVYRVNKKGIFNTPFGKNVNAPICDIDNILACSRVLNNRTFLMQGDFSNAVKGAEAGDLVYFDPPYVPVSDTADFTGYTSVGFTMQDQRRLADCFRTLVNRGCHVFLSNADVPAIRELYSDFETIVIPARRSINSNGAKRGAVNEVVVTSRSVPT